MFAFALAADLSEMTFVLATFTYFFVTEESRGLFAGFFPWLDVVVAFEHACAPFRARECQVKAGIDMKILIIGPALWCGRLVFIMAAIGSPAAFLFFASRKIIIVMTCSIISISITCKFAKSIAREYIRMPTDIFAIFIPIGLLFIDGRLAIARHFVVGLIIVMLATDAVSLYADAAFHTETVATRAVALLAGFDLGRAFALFALLALFALGIAADAAFLIEAGPVFAEFPADISALIFIILSSVPRDFMAVADQHTRADNNIVIEFINVAVERVVARRGDFPAVFGTG